MRRYLITVVVLVLALVAVLPAQAQATNIHMHFYESVDVLLETSSFQLFSVSMLAGERLTLVAYGLDEGLSPAITLLDPLGVAVAEDLNSDGDGIAWVQESAQYNGLYTFTVSRQGDSTGLIRVMVVEGTAFEDPVIIRDNLDPFAPSRAFIFGGDNAEPVTVSIDVLEPEDEQAILPEVFASRGSTEELPDEEQRRVPVPLVEPFSWLNDEDLPFYTINVRPFPEVQPAAKVPGHSFLRQVFDITDYLLYIGDGETGEVIEINRQYCNVGGVEVTGIVREGGREFYQVINPDGSVQYVPFASLNVPLNSPECSRVQEVIVPSGLLPNPPSGTGGGGAGTLFGLPPLDDGPDSDPGCQPGDPCAGVVTPPPPPPPNEPPPATPFLTVNGSCEVDSALVSGEISISFGNLPGAATQLQFPDPSGMVNTHLNPSSPFNDSFSALPGGSPWAGTATLTYVGGSISESFSITCDEPPPPDPSVFATASCISTYYGYGWDLVVNWGISDVPAGELVSYNGMAASGLVSGSLTGPFDSSSDMMSVFPGTYGGTINFNSPSLGAVSANWTADCGSFYYYYGPYGPALERGAENPLFARPDSQGQDGLMTASAIGLLGLLLGLRGFSYLQKRRQP